jgi:GAF domain-containing protein
MKPSLPLADELYAVHARMSGLLLSEETVSSALQLVVSLAKETVPGSTGAGVTLVDGDGRKTTAVATDPLVERADALQYELDDGPCLTAWAQRTVVQLNEIPTDARFPQWAEAVQELGLWSSLSAPLVAGDDALGAVKVYSVSPRAYDSHSQHLLTMFAAQAAIVVANMQSLENAKRVSDELKETLRGRDVINMAKGILMAREGLNESAAFSSLVETSRQADKKLLDVAQQLVVSTLRKRR